MFKNTIENAPIGMALVSPTGKYLSVNVTMHDTLGYDMDELRNMTMMDITHPDDIKASLEVMNKLLNGEVQIAHLEKRYIRKDKTTIWAMASISLIRDENGNPLNFIVQIVDMSERIQNEEKMMALNKQTLETLNELKLIEHDENLLNKLNRMLQICISQEEAYPRIKIIAQDIFPDLSGGLSIFNKSEHSLHTVLHWGKDNFLQSTFLPADCFAIREGTINIVDNPSKAVPCSHYQTPIQGGYMSIPLIVQNDLIGSIHLLAAPGKKISQHEQDTANTFSSIIKLALANINLRISLHDLSLHDPLTKLYNRRYLTEILTRELLRVVREKTKLCFAILDVDNFKKFNDTFGHDAGDKALQLIAASLSNFFRGSDVSFRFGGEEFVVVMLGTDIKNAAKRLDQFREKIKHEPLYYNERLLPSLTISIGVAESPQHGKSIDDLLRSADQALYTAKNAGKDKVEFFQFNSL